MNRTLYSLLLHLCLPLLGLRLAWRAWRAPAYAQRINERFALNLPPLKPGGIWVHAVSVGESIAAAPMIRELLARYPQLPITITCMTPTGSERIQALFGGPEYQGRVQHCYLPYDLPWAAARFLDRLQPLLAVIMETELWPNHIAQCARRGIAVVVANARLSARSARGYARFANLSAPMLAQLSWVAAQTQVEAERFIALGAKPECVQVTGSIKFDLRIDPALLQRATALRAEWQGRPDQSSQPGVAHASVDQSAAGQLSEAQLGAARPSAASSASPNVPRPVWIAASTHAGEDEVVLAAHRQLLAQQPDALLILVPRHPERFATVFELCVQAGFATRRRSTGEALTPGDQVLLGDTMGELLFLYALADSAFVGGSLVANGGHNLLEPAALGKPVLSGPHLFNFLEIAAQLRSAGALQEVTDAATLAEQVAILWREPARAVQMREAGLAVLHANQGALARLLAGLERLLDEPPKR
ncbi:MAG: 3-deoxy-D-manno-octulosonic acid transferase [Pseudomonas sp.]